MSAATDHRDCPVLERDERGDIRLWMVWALMPGNAQVVAVCSSARIAGRYKPFVTDIHVGARFHVEPFILDHLFGAADMTSVAFRAARAWAKPTDAAEALLGTDGEAGSASK